MTIYTSFRTVPSRQVTQDAHCTFARLDINPEAINDLFVPARQSLCDDAWERKTYRNRVSRHCA